QASATQWKAGVEALRQANPDVLATWIGTTGSEACMEAATARPPYAGARPLLRWRQTTILHAGSAFMVHPRNAPVQLDVRVSDLKQELGLSDDSAALLTRLAGPERLDEKTKRRVSPCWYNSEEDTLSIAADRYNDRESNRRLALEQLQALVKECDTRYPGETTPAKQYLSGFGFFQ
uniref:mS35 n=1 Tax=Polytomella magna TaxID=353565 RepID=UPI002240E46E|nr:Chain BA, mS35 [Polytomella magna]8APN_BA Chain BA, mS35 [Polytomella magna]8APO_BA Chain BA, mS35 [Polytomella magna]